ncbi:putative urea active transporter 3 [Wickerhamomyces ciferrii]|uniref:Urea active transporter 3 n=1 Tax=Wickerhamomyces ciferrii (strain ATCC 14091 / BCRC 22168 / CBS 111 / JCM 3599 / NBRC 0793 / NRRL Y-1031 F-60-10) TaxID=1206466 RepID=K0KHH1_WICCF|nr:putative urea active transporter 3 [Wickerhamomyces ciferrii]CCH44665.1 putative urea active transporter 3 [Wickerhamomyces ciferrii]
MSEASELLSQGAGYGVLIGGGVIFTLFILITTKLNNKYLNEDSKSTEMFMVANRSVGIGLTASSVYSSWTWATELLWVTAMVYNYGVQSAFWYAAGGSIQICLLAIIGIESKKKIPTSHTCLEIVQLRYGKVAHILYMILCLINNLVSASSMILGAAAAISMMCDNLHIVASSLLIPFGVLLYTSFGGLKSTFLTDYVHSFILLIILCYINTAAISSDHIGGVDGLYNKVVSRESAGELRYIDGNYKGSFLTGKSQGALFFGLIHSIGDTGLTIMDSSYWQKSFSADVKANVPGYLIAAVLLYANDWAIGVILGLANVIIEDLPIFPTYPNKMTDLEVNSGFGLIYTVKALLGTGALRALLLVIYLSVTSTVSAQLISVSSIISFDIFKKYLKPNATNKQLIRISHLGVVFFGFFAAGFSIMLQYVGVDMTWFAYFYSMINCPGVIPMIFLLTWKHQTKAAFIISPILGIIGGLGVWIGTAYKLHGEATIKTLGEQLPCLYGGLTALLLPGFATVLISLIKPANYDWNLLTDKSHLIAIDQSEVDKFEKDINAGSKLDYNLSTLEIGFSNENENANESKVELESGLSHSNDQKIINKYRIIAYVSSILILLITWVLWPLPLYRDYIWSKAFFRGSTIMGLVWCYAAFIGIGLYPLYDGRNSFKRIFNGIRGNVKDFRNTKKI